MQHANESFGAIKRYCAANLYLVAIAPVNGKPTKAPRAKGWNQPKDLSNPGGYSANADDFKGCNGSNIGLYHGASQTLALDLDDVELACKIFDELTGNQLIDWLKDPLRVEIKSPKANRGKLLFKFPTLTQSVGLRQFKHDGKVIFELRCGNCQDVIYGQHPEGGAYQFIGNPAEIPLIPDVLLNMLQHWEDWKLCFDSVLGMTTQPPEIQPRKPQQGENLPGRRNPIELFNQAKGGVVPVLLDNGYKQLGSDRLVRPGSESKAPGIIILRECTDGIERVFSHGGDVLNDGFAHDAWDCYRLLQCAGDSTQALNWDPAITKHNQRLFMQEKAKTAAQTPATDNPKKTAEAKLPKTQRTLPDGTALNDQHINILEQLNRDYAHTVLGGKNVIVGQRVCQVQGSVFTFSVNMERKGLEIEPIPNYCRLIFASNHTRVLNAGIRERRYLVLEPSDEKAQDTAYFKSLWAWIKDGGAAKLLHYLLQVDISRFDPYKCPQTKALIAEKLANLSGINRFFYEQIVMKDELFGGKARIFAADLVDDFVAWSRDDDDVKIHKPAARNMVGKMMVRLGITVDGRSDRGEGKSYDLPERKELITSFAKLLDVPEDEL
ncbi:MAG: bifunctional DNA primase/polymerase [Methylobacter sp.]